MASREGTRQPGGKPAGAAEPRSVEAAELLGSGREVVILHRGERYRLRVTLQGKLILTK